MLFLAESFWPVLGGGEQHIRQLAAALVARGMACTVITRRGDSSWPSDEQLDGVRILRVAPSGPGRTGKYLMVLPAMRRLLSARASFDVVVVRGTRVLGLPGLVAARLAGSGVVLQAEVSGEMSGEIYTWGTRLDHSPLKRVVRAGVALRNLLLRDADACVTISKRTQAEFLEAGMPPHRIVRLPHGIDTARFRPASAEERSALRAQLGLPAEALLIVFTGRLLKGKGIETLLTAFKRVASDGTLVHLAIVGSGADQALSIEADLREFVERSGLGQQVTFTGRVENVPDWLRAADIYGFPSFFEAMPLSILEAAACGLPSATTRIGGIVDVIDDGVSGLLIEPGDVDGLTASLRRLARDPELRQRLGAAARRKIVEHFAFDQNVERYRALFNAVCNRRPLTTEASR